MFIMWRAIHSEFFASILSKYTNKYITKYLNSSTRFESISLEFFPPGASLHGISFEDQKNDITLKLNAKKISIYFNMFAAFNNKLTISELEVSDSIAELIIKENISKSKAGDERFENKIQFDELNKILSELPVSVRSISLNDFYLKTNNGKAYLQRVKLGFDKKTWDLWFDIRQMKHPLVDKEWGGIESAKGYVVLNQHQLSLREFEARKGFVKLSVKGEITNPFEVKKNIEVETLLSGYCPELTSYLPAEYEFISYGGFIEIWSKLSGPILKPNVNALIRLDNVSTNFFDVDELAIKASYNTNELRVSQLDFSYKNEKLNLSNEFVLYDFKTNTLFPLPTQLEARGVSIKNGLKFLSDVLEPLSGELHGKFFVGALNNKIIFTPLKGFELRNFNLSTIDDDKRSTIIENESLVFNAANFIIDGPVFRLDADVSFGQSNVKIKGKVGNGNVDFISELGDINLENLGKISGLDIKGSGKMQFNIKGPYDNVVFNFTGQLQESSFEQYFLGNTSLDLSIKLKPGEILLNSISGKLLNTLYFSKGTYSYRTNAINLSVNTPHTTFTDIKSMYKPLVDKLQWTPSELNGLVGLNYQVQGKVSLGEMIVNGKLLAENVIFYTESLPKISTQFKLATSKLSFSNIIFEKETANLSGFFNYDFITSNYNYFFDLKNAYLNEINITKNIFRSLTAKIDGKISGEKKSSEKINLELFFTGSKVNGRPVNDSDLKMSLNKEVLAFELNYIGKNLILNGEIDFKEDQKSEKNLSFIKSKLDISNLKTFVSSFIGEHLYNSNLLGSVNTQLEGHFNIHNISKLDLNATILNLKIVKDDVLIESLQPGYFLVEKGNIKSWHFESVGNKGLIVSNGKGSFYSKYNVHSIIDLDANLLEVISDKIVKIDGVIRSEVIFSDNYKLGFSFITSTDKFDFGYEGLPTTLQETKAKFVFDGERLSIEKFNSRLSNGSLDMKGEVIVQFPYPKININYKLDEANFSFIEKSNFILSGSGALLGERIPYRLSGELFLDSGLIQAEFDELASKGALSIGKSRHLPEKSNIKESKLIDSNVSVNLKGPVVIKNSMVDMSFNGDINVLESIFEPKITGKLSVIPGLGRFFFKSNEFAVSKGEIYFSENSNSINPELDFIANTAIDEYNITMRILGTSENFNIGLNSEPALARNDILSLIAFGYTDEQTKGLSGQARNEISSVGVGTLLFESFKINEALKSEFGVKLNVGTQLDDSQQSFLQGTSSGEGAGTRVRSATKVEVQKRLNEAMSLSVSSTVGGAIGQRQSMNLNYKINDTMSLEGVYQTKTNEDGEEDIIDNSMGVDVKFRWSTK